MKKYLITSALPYANGYLHLGHIAGAYLSADMFARFLRLSGERVLYVCGSDEHGVAITIAAEQQKVSPREIIDHYHNANLEAFSAFGWSFDTYGRTSYPRHHQLAQQWFRDFSEKGLLVEKEEDQFYDETAQMFLPDRYVEGICPNCSFEGARGDQCDNCGAYYNQLELRNPRSRVSGNAPVVRKTKHWYFPLGAFQSKLEEYIESHAGEWKDNVLQQSRSWLKQGLGDRAITRDLRWGVPVPHDHAEGKVLYVWFDAVLGYISATQTWASAHGNENEWKQWWLNANEYQATEQTEYVAFIGKDNIVFHTLMFPAMLMAHGDYILPANVPANEFLNLQGQKFSKSRNWSVDLRDAMNLLPSESQRDALRYTLAMNFPETRDSDFTWADYQTRTNNELAAILGNFVNRSVQFLHANFGAKVPVLPERYSKLDEAWDLLLADFRRLESTSVDVALELYAAKHLRYFNARDCAFLAAMHFGARKVSAHYRAYRFRDALSESMNVARAANKYFNDCEPWKTIKSDRDECAKTLYICAQSLRSLALLFAPVMPHVCHTIQHTLGLHIPYCGQPMQGKRGQNLWATIGEAQIAQDTTVNASPILFTKVEDAFIRELQSQLGSHHAAVGNAAVEETEDNLISIDDFRKVQLRTARVLTAERVAKSDKLLRLNVDTGSDHRQIVAGIAKHYSPDELVDTMVVVVTNLKPAKLMGLESKGMLLAANSDQGLSLISPRTQTPVGAEVR